MVTCDRRVSDRALAGASDEDTDAVGAAVNARYGAADKRESADLQAAAVEITIHIGNSCPSSQSFATGPDPSRVRRTAHTTDHRIKVGQDIVAPDHERVPPPVQRI